jgi:uncharacterized protein YbjT (DUF2867 family)
MSLRVIVFGPTGNVASIVARTAQNRGAKVFLAMRDLHKEVPGLSPNLETEGSFERVQADLTQPSSVHSAISQTKATSAFMYVAHRSTDHMRATLEASKAAGVKFVVFLSSFTITKELDQIPSSTHIPYVHARVEINLEEIYGHENYVALRVGAFATNTLRWRAGIASGQIDLESPNTEYDFITPTDMGRVGGRILVDGQSHGQHIVYLYGPQLMAQKDAIAIVIRALGKDVQVVEGRHELSKQPATKGQRVIVRLGPEERKSDWFSVAYDNFHEGVDNVSKYTGEPGTSFKSWVEENKFRYDGA